MKSLLKIALFSLIFAQTVMISAPPSEEAETQVESFLACGKCR